jgi:hypothetical protein
MLETIDRKLDMSFSMSARVRDLGFSFLGDLESVPMSMYLHAKETSFNFFLDRASVEKSSLIRYYNPVYYGNFVIVSQKVELPVIRVMYQNISSVPSMILTRFYTFRGGLFVEYRFHSSDLKHVSNLTKVLISVGKDIRVTRICESVGVSSSLDDINAKLPLSVVQFSYGEENAGDYVTEWRGVSDPFGAVSYGKDGKRYEGRIDFSKSSISPLFRTLLKDQIQPVTYFEEHKKSFVKSTVFLPSLLTKSFLVRFFNLENSVNGLRLESIAPYAQVREDL